MKTRLTAGERAVLEALLPSRAHPTLPGLFETGFDDFYADFQRTALFSMRLGFQGALWAAQLIAPLLIGRLPPLSRHPIETRERALEAMSRSRVYLFRQLLLLLKAVAAFGYGAHPGVRRAVGYPVRMR